MGGRVYYWDWDEVLIIGWEEEFIVGIGMRCLLLGLGEGSYYWVGRRAHY